MTSSGSCFFSRGETDCVFKEGGGVNAKRRDGAAASSASTRRSRCMEAKLAACEASSAASLASRRRSSAETAPPTLCPCAFMRRSALCSVRPGVLVPGGVDPPDPPDESGDTGNALASRSITVRCDATATRSTASESCAAARTAFAMSKEGAGRGDKDEVLWRPSAEGVVGRVRMSCSRRPISVRRSRSKRTFVATKEDASSTKAGWSRVAIASRAAASAASREGVAAARTPVPPFEAASGVISWISTSVTECTTSFAPARSVSDPKESLPESLTDGHPSLPVSNDAAPAPKSKLASSRRAGARRSSCSLSLISPSTVRTSKSNTFGLANSAAAGVALTPESAMLTSASGPAIGVETSALGVGTSTPFALRTSASVLASCSAASARACCAFTFRANPSTRETYSWLISFRRCDAARPWSISAFFKFSMWSRNTSFSCLALIAERSCRCTSSSVGSRDRVSTMYVTCCDTSESLKPVDPPFVRFHPGLAGGAASRDWGTPGEPSAPGAMLDDLEIVPRGVRGAPPPAAVLRRDIGVRAPGASPRLDPVVGVLVPLAISRGGVFLGSVSRAGEGAKGDADRGEPPGTAVPPARDEPRRASRILASRHGAGVCGRKHTPDVIEIVVFRTSPTGNGFRTFSAVSFVTFSWSRENSRLALFKSSCCRCRVSPSSLLSSPSRCSRSPRARARPP